MTAEKLEGIRLVRLVHPDSGDSLRAEGDILSDGKGSAFPKIGGIYRFVQGSNYADSFGFQWNAFARTQIDSAAKVTQSKERFFSETCWPEGGLRDIDLLEVGSGAGRFSEVILAHTGATLYSVDYSNAVEANRLNNGHYGDRFKLFQASIYGLPFAAGSFDKVLCLGVLQHTPDFEASVRSLIAMAKPGGEIVVDFYPIRGFWTKLNAKYLLRPLTRRLPPQQLLKLIEANIDWLIRAHSFLQRCKLGFLNRFLPVCIIESAFLKTVSQAELRQRSILDTLDQYSPEHDHPQRIANVKKMFERNGAVVTFAGFVPYGNGMWAAVVRGVRGGADPE